MVDADWVLDAGKLTQHFSHHPIDYLKIVPSHLQALLRSSSGSGVLPRRWLVVGGEASSWELIRQVKARGEGCRVLNHYGEILVRMHTSPAASLRFGLGVVHRWGWD